MSRYSFTGKSSGLHGGSAYPHVPESRRIEIGAHEQVVLRDCVINGNLTFRTERDDPDTPEVEGAVPGHYGKNIVIDNVTVANGRLKLVDGKQYSINGLSCVYLSSPMAGTIGLAIVDRFGKGQGHKIENFIARGADYPLVVRGNSEGVSIVKAKIAGCRHGIEIYNTEPFFKILDCHINSVFAPIHAPNIFESRVVGNSLYTSVPHGALEQKNQWQDGASYMLACSGSENIIRENYHRWNPETWRNKWDGVARVSAFG